MRLSRCDKLHTSPLTGHWFRAIPQEHWKTRLSARHTANGTGRFSAGSDEAPSYQILYLAKDQQLALFVFEVEALLGGPLRPITASQATWVILNLFVKLSFVVDLTDEVQQRTIGTNLQELTGDWVRYQRTGKAPTQFLGAALYDHPTVEGFLVPSAKLDSTNLVVFPEKLHAPSSYIEFKNPSSGKIERVRP